MILVDTNIWIDFLRGRPHARPLSDLLTARQVVSHPWIFGELMMGSLGPKRSSILSDLGLLPILPLYDIDELRDFIDREKLYGLGLSLVDIQLLYTTILNDSSLWTHDGQLHKAAIRFKTAYRGVF